MWKTQVSRIQYKNRRMRIAMHPLRFYLIVVASHSFATWTSTTSAFSVAPSAVSLKTTSVRTNFPALQSSASRSVNAPERKNLDGDGDGDGSSSSGSSTSAVNGNPVNYNALLHTSDPTDASYSASDWLHNIKSLPRSSILREIKGPVITITIWSSIVALVHKLFVSTNPLWARRMCIDSTPHSFLVSSLGLLLVFRTNSAYQRFAEGRKIWEKILSVSRNLSRLVCLYEQDLGRSRQKRVFRMLAAFPYLLQHHIQQDDNHTHQNHHQHQHNHGHNSASTKSIPATTSVAMDRKSLPWSLLPKSTWQKCANSLNRPLWICDRLSQEFTNVAYTPNFTSRERLDFLNQVDKLSQCIGECERIHQTAVPLNYARHSLRSVTLWLFSLPFALIDNLGMSTAPVMGVIAWVLFGTYQIGYQIEDPFQGSLRLSILCDAIYRDVMMMMSIEDTTATTATTANGDAGIGNKNNYDIATTVGLRESAFTMSDMEMEEWEDFSIEQE